MSADTPTYPGSSVGKLAARPMIDRPERTALAVIAVHNLVQNQLLNQRGYVAGNLAVSAILVGVGRSAGLGWDDMGLQPNRLRAGLRTGAGASVAAVIAGLAALAGPRARPYLRDERARVPRTEIWRRALIRFPMGTALFEEVAFRGVLPALFGRTRRPVVADVISAGVFTLWHFIPTSRALAGNPLHGRLTASRRVAAVVGGSAVAGGFGLVFSWMRRRSDSVAAPWLAHASLNTVSFLAGVVAHRRRSTAADAQWGTSPISK